MEPADSKNTVMKLGPYLTDLVKMMRWDLLSMALQKQQDFRFQYNAWWPNKEEEPRDKTRWRGLLEQWRLQPCYFGDLNCSIRDAIAAITAGGTSYTVAGDARGDTDDQKRSGNTEKVSDKNNKNGTGFNISCTIYLCILFYSVSKYWSIIKFYKYLIKLQIGSTFDSL